MAATRLISGTLREVWQEAIPTAGGVTPIQTSIRLSTGQLSRVRGILAITTISGTPACSVALSVVGGRLLVTLTNAGAAGDTIVWTLDVSLVHSIAQSSSAEAGVVIITSAGSSVLNLIADAGAPSIVDLPDADTTVHPGTTNTTLYRVPAQTGNRITILGTNGPPQTGQMVEVLRRDLGATTREIVNGGPLADSLYTFPAAPAVPWIASFQYNGADWQFVGTRPLAAV